MKKICLHGKYGDGRVTLVDDDIYDVYKNVNLVVSHNGYVILSTEGKRLHRLITSCPANMVVDHKNHNRLDNRRKNLRVCTQKENANNLKGVKNYYYDKTHGRWVVEYKGKFCGYYDSEDEAKKQVQLFRSGQKYAKKNRVGVHLPKNIYAYNRNRAGGVRYCFTQIINGVRHSKFGFKTITDAEQYKNKFNERRIG